MAAAVALFAFWDSMRMPDEHNPILRKADQVHADFAAIRHAETTFSDSASSMSRGKRPLFTQLPRLSARMAG
jgi:hypothetical protein